MKKECSGLAVLALIAGSFAVADIGLFSSPVAAQESKASSWANYPERVRPPAGAPNILIIMTDDVGFGAVSGVGGPIPTPAFDRVAQEGLLYNQFHTTAMCSPTRAALLTGRNHHSVGSGVIANMSTDEPGYTSVIPQSAGTIGRVLGDHGYATAWLGKNHNTPVWETASTGPFDHWPNAMGFDYFYGFNGDRTNQFFPELTENRNPVDPPREDGYILDRDLADHAISWLRRQESASPDRPFLLYYAPGTAHVPVQAPAGWIARFKGRFADGWDVERQRTFERQKALGVIPADAELTPRPRQIPAWSSLTEAQKQIAERQMEAYAAALAFCDDQIGRILAELKRSGKLDNTLVLYLQGDNGAAAENMWGAFNQYAAFGGANEQAHTLAHLDELGGPNSFPAYPVGWAWAMNTPFQWAKMAASHFGGTRNALAVSWPHGIKSHGIRPQFHHVIDLAPTIYEVTGIKAPAEIDGVEQQPIEGVSMAYSFNDSAVPTHRKSQYFEMIGNRAFYKDGWIASTTPKRLPWEAAIPKGKEDAPYKWELYNLSTDFSQAHDLSNAQSAKLAKLKAGFDEAAKKYRVLPIDDTFLPRFAANLRPGVLDGKRSVTYFADDQRIAASQFPDLTGEWKGVARFSTSTAQASGPIIASGDKFSGWSLYLRAGVAMMIYRPTDQQADRVSLAGKTALLPGAHEVRFGVSIDGKARTLWLEIDGKHIGRAPLPRAARPAAPSYVGRAGEAPLIEDTSVPDRFEGVIDQVTIDFAP